MSWSMISKACRFIASCLWMAVGIMGVLMLAGINIETAERLAMLVASAFMITYAINGVSRDRD